MYVLLRRFLACSGLGSSASRVLGRRQLYITSDVASHTYWEEIPTTQYLTEHGTMTDSNELHRFGAGLLEIIPDT
jgi:hypothetical protein